MDELALVDLYEKSDEKHINAFIEKMDSNMSVKTDYEKVIKDIEWIEKMEETIPYLDNIFRNPNRFIINEEEIVKIELARKITVESVKHLSKNTNLIQDINEKTGDVRPSKILNINKEESYDTYENRFIYSLVQNMKFFISRKKKIIEENQKYGVKNTKKIEYSGIAKVLNESININISLNSKIDNESAEEDNNNILEKIEKIEKRLADLCTSETYTMLSKKHISLVTTPIKKTNVILKNVNFQYAIKLWNYLQENINDKTKKINEKKDYQAEGKLKRLADESFLLDYLILTTLGQEEEQAKNNQIKEILVDKMLEKMMDMDSNLTEEQLKKMIINKYVTIKYKKMATLEEIQKNFKKSIEKYIEKID